MKQTEKIAKVSISLKAVAAFTLMAFIFTQTAISAPTAFAHNSNVPGGDPVSVSTAQALNGMIAVPPELGKIEESFQGTSGKTILFIQDAHDSLEAQENIAKLIDRFVKEKGIKTVFEEGYEGQVPTDEFFGFIKDPKIKRKVSYFLLDKLRLGGAEYAHVNRTHDFKLIGVENLKLYAENIKAYRDSSQNRKEIETDLTELFAQISLLANQYFPKELKTWLRFKERSAKGELPLLDYLKKLRALHLKVSADPVHFPHEYAALSILLAAETTKDKKLIGQLNALDSKLVFEEMNRLEKELSNTFLQNNRDKQIFDYYQGLTLLKRLNQIQLTQSEYDAAKATLHKLDTRKLADFIVSLTRKSLLLSKEWERHIKDAVRFYDVAQLRDVSINECLSSFIESKKEDTAALVFGGFHATAIKELLRQHGISYVVVTPRITKIEKRHQDYYHELMSAGHYPFETPFLVTRANKPPSIYFSAEISSGEMAVRAELRAITSTISMLGDHFDSQLIIQQLERNNVPQRSEMRGNHLAVSESMLKHFYDKKDLPRIYELGQKLIQYVNARQIHDVGTNSYRNLDADKDLLAEGSFDVMVVFGSGYLDVSKEAARIGRELRKKNPEMKIIVVGNYGTAQQMAGHFMIDGKRVSEAKYFQAIIQSKGVKVDFLGEESENTKQNVKEFRRIVNSKNLHPKKVVIVSALHRRAGPTFTRWYLRKGGFLSSLGLEKVALWSPGIDLGAWRQGEALAAIKDAVKEVGKIEEYSQDLHRDSPWITPTPIPPDIAASAKELHKLLSMPRSEMRTEAEEIKEIVEKAYGLHVNGQPKVLTGSLWGKYRGHEPYVIETRERGRLAFKFLWKRSEKARYAVEFMQRLRESGLPVPELVSRRDVTASDDPTDVYIMEHRGAFYVLETFLAEGHEVLRENATEEHFREIGKLAARIQNAVEEFQPRHVFSYKTRHEVYETLSAAFPEMEKAVDSLGSVHGAENEVVRDVLRRREQLRRLVEAQLGYLKKNFPDRGLRFTHIHNDLHLGNLKFAEDGSISALFDFNLVQADHRIAEFNNLLFWMIKGSDSTVFRPEMFRAVLAGYEQTLNVPLTPEEKVAIWESLRLRFIEEVTRVYSTKPDAAESIFRDPVAMRGWFQTLDVLTHFAPEPFIYDGRPVLEPGGTSFAGQRSEIRMPIIAAHRGGSPNNHTSQVISLDSIRESIALGVGAIEFDVQMTSDGYIVSTHAGKLGGKKIGAMTLAQVRAIEPELPTLDQIYEVMKESSARFNIHIVWTEGKNQALINKLAEFIKAKGIIDRSIVFSFYSGDLLSIEKALPDVERCRVFFAHELKEAISKKASDPMLLVNMANEAHAQYITWPRSDTYPAPDWYLIGRLKKAGLKIDLGTKTNPTAAEVRSYMKSGADILTVIDPKSFLESEKKLGWELKLPEKDIKFDDDLPLVVETFAPGDMHIKLDVTDEAFKPNGESRGFFDRPINTYFVDGKPRGFGVVDEDMTTPREDFGVRYDKENPGRDTFVLTGSNLGWNSFHIGVVNGKVYYYRYRDSSILSGNSLYHLTESLTPRVMLVVRKRQKPGEPQKPEAMPVSFKRLEDGTVRVIGPSATDGKPADITDEIETAFYGLPLVKPDAHGVPQSNLSEVFDQLDDLRHLFRFPMFQFMNGEQWHLGMSDGVGAFYKGENLRADLLAGKPVTLSVEPLLNKGVTFEEIEKVYDAWGYRGKYRLDREAKTISVAYEPGTHPQSYFGVDTNGNWFVGAENGGAEGLQTHYRGTSLKRLAEELIEKHHAKYVWVFSNGKDVALRLDSVHSQANGLRKRFIEALIFSRSVWAMADKYDEDFKGNAVKLGPLLKKIRDNKILEEVGLDLEPLVKDGHHGFRHALEVAGIAAELAREEAKVGTHVDFDVVALGALFHDIRAVKDRKNHAQAGGFLVPDILKKTGVSLTTEQINAVAEVVKNHSKSAHELANTSRESGIVRDADTYIEATDLRRIVEVSMTNFHRPFFNPDLNLEHRLKVLASESGAIVDAKENDALMYLLRNVTKDVDPAHYVTEAAKKRIANENLRDRNKAELLSLGQKHDAGHAKEIADCIDQVINAYAHNPHRSEMRMPDDSFEERFREKFKEKWPKKMDLYQENPSHTGSRYRRLYDAMCGLFGVDIPNDTMRDVEGKRLLDLLYAQDNDALVQFAVDHLENYTFVASGAHRYASLALAIKNQFRGRNLLDSKAVDEFSSVSSPVYDYLRQMHPFYAGNVYDVERPARLPELKVLPPKKRDADKPYRFLDIGSAPKKDGAPSLNALRDMAEKDPDFKGKRFEIIGLDIFFPVFEEKDGKVMIREDADQPQKEIGRLHFFDSSKADYANVMSPGFNARKELGVFDYIALTMTLHHLTDHENEKYGEMALANVPLYNEQGKPFEKKYVFAETQQSVLTKLLESLDDRGIFFLNFWMHPTIGRERLKAAGLYEKYLEQLAISSNADTFIVIQRVGGRFIVHEKVISFRPNLEKEGSENFLLNGKEVFYGYKRITDLYPGVQPDGGEDYQKVRRLFQREKDRQAEAMGVRSVFRAIIGADESVRGGLLKSSVTFKRDHLRRIMKELSLPGEAVAMIGDSPFDMIAAKQVGAIAVGFATDEKSRTELISGGADMILNGNYAGADSMIDIFGSRARSELRLQVDNASAQTDAAGAAAPNWMENSQKTEAPAISTAIVSLNPAKIVAKPRAQLQPATVFVNAEDWGSFSEAQKREYFLVALSRSESRIIVYNENGQIHDKDLAALLKLERVERTEGNLGQTVRRFANPHIPAVQLSKELLPAATEIQKLRGKVAFFRTVGNKSGTLATALLWAISGGENVRFQGVHQEDGFWTVDETLLDAIQRTYENNFVIAIAA